MGAWIRTFERRIERNLLSYKSRGVAGPSSSPAIRPDRVAPQTAATDRRELLPVMGLREYWYPALPVSRVGRRPLFWTMLGDELVLFRDAEGKVVALSDVCPHRGASLSEGSCFYKGFVTCPYHGATFDGSGECKAFLTEGPDSTMVGKLRVRTYPTRVIRDWVFIWLGRGEPAPIEEDVPAEFFDSSVVVLSNYTYHTNNWMVVIENHGDAHNCFFVHRNSVSQLQSTSPGRPRTPLGPGSKLVNGRALLGLNKNGDYYEEHHGKVPYQMYYPGVDGVWPLHRWRLLWTWIFKKDRFRTPRLKVPEEWQYGHHLPSMMRTASALNGMNTLCAVPVTPNLTRFVQFCSFHPKSRARAAWAKLRYSLYLKWMSCYNFQGQDNRGYSSLRYRTPEYLSPTDSHLIQLRKLITTYSRDVLRARSSEALPGPAETPAEEASYVLQRQLGLMPEIDLVHEPQAGSSPAETVAV